MRNGLNHIFKIVLLICFNFVLIGYFAGCVFIKVPIGEKKIKSSKSYHISREGLRLVALLPISISGDSKVGPITGFEQNEAYYFFYNALKQRGYKVVPKTEVELSIQPYALETDFAYNIGMIKNVGRELDVDGVITGEIRRFNNNSWQSDSNISEYRASAHILLSLYRSRDGKKIWQRVFNETQKPFFANMAHAAKYPGGGTRWLSDKEFAQWGVNQLVGTLAEDCPPYRR